MGYESRFYIVKKGSLMVEDDGKIWSEVIASFNMSKVPDVYTHIKKYPKTNCYFYIGNNKIVEDNYGDELIEIPINDMIAIMSEVIKEDPEYRRFRPFLFLLLGFNLEQWYDNLVVLHYGY
jgi:hypothetical protein